MTKELGGVTQELLVLCWSSLGEHRGSTLCIKYIRLSETIFLVYKLYTLETKCISCIHLKKMLTALQIPHPNIRTHPQTGTPSAVDVICALIGVKNGRQTWNAIKKRNENLESLVQTCQERGGKVDYLTKEAFLVLVSDIRTNKAKGREMLSNLRIQINTIAKRFWENDATLATELIEKIDDPEKLEFIAQRANSKLTQRMLTDSVKEAGGYGQVYAIINNCNDVVITGKNAKQIVASRSITKGKKRVATRDLFTIEELVELQFLELSEQRAIKQQKVKGNTEIIKTQSEVLSAFKTFRQHVTK